MSSAKPTPAPRCAGVEMGVLAKLGIARPRQQVVACPALPHKPDQSFWAGAQSGVEPVGEGLPAIEVPSAHRHCEQDRTHSALSSRPRVPACSTKLSGPHATGINCVKRSLAVAVKLLRSNWPHLAHVRKATWMINRVAPSEPCV